MSFDKDDEQERYLVLHKQLGLFTGFTQMSPLSPTATPTWSSLNPIGGSAMLLDSVDEAEELVEILCSSNALLLHKAFVSREEISLLGIQVAKSEGHGSIDMRYLMIRPDLEELQTYLQVWNGLTIAMSFGVSEPIGDA